MCIRDRWCTPCNFHSPKVAPASVLKRKKRRVSQSGVFGFVGGAHLLAAFGNEVFSSDRVSHFVCHQSSDGHASPGRVMRKRTTYTSPAIQQTLPRVRLEKVRVFEHETLSSSMPDFCGSHLSPKSLSRRFITDCLKLLRPRLQIKQVPSMR